MKSIGGVQAYCQDLVDSDDEQLHERHAEGSRRVTALAD